MREISAEKKTRVTFETSPEMLERLMIARGRTRKSIKELMTEWTERGLAELEASYPVHSALPERRAS